MLAIIIFRNVSNCNFQKCYIIWLRDIHIRPQTDPRGGESCWPLSIILNFRARRHFLQLRGFRCPSYVHDSFRIRVSLFLYIYIYIYVVISNKSTLHPSSGDAVTVAAAFGGLENIPLHKKHGSLVASLLVLELRHWWDVKPWKAEEKSLLSSYYFGGTRKPNSIVPLGYCCRQPYLPSHDTRGPLACMICLPTWSFQGKNSAPYFVVWPPP